LNFEKIPSWLKQKTFQFPFQIGITLANHFPAFQGKTWHDNYFLPAYLFSLVMNRWLANTRKDETAKYPIYTFQHHLPAFNSYLLFGINWMLSLKFNNSKTKKHQKV